MRHSREPTSGRYIAFPVTSSMRQGTPTGRIGLVGCAFDSSSIN